MDKKIYAIQSCPYCRNEVRAEAGKIPIGRCKKCRSYVVMIKPKLKEKPETKLRFIIEADESGVAKVTNGARAIYDRLKQRSKPCREKTFKKRKNAKSGNL